MNYGVTKLATDFDELDMSHWKVKLVKALFFFIPKANPDVEKLYPLVKSWALEIDAEGWPQREVGLDIHGTPLFFTPNDKNTGFWTDMAAMQFSQEQLSPVSKNEFEQLWSTAINTCPNNQILRSITDRDEIEPMPLPTWITVPFGLFLLPICLLSIIGSITIIFIPNPPNPLLNLIGGSLFVVLSICVTGYAGKLAFNLKKNHPGLFTPIVLRILGICAILIPIIALVVGTFWEKPITHFLMAITYIFAAIGLWKLAATREISNKDINRN